jgi:Tfp pilus assembly protein PilZ
MLKMNTPTLNKEAGKYNVTLAKLFKLIVKMTDEQQLQLLQTAEDMLWGERRGKARKECVIPVDYAIQNRIIKSTIRNISGKGVFLATREPLRIGTQIAMNFALPGFTDTFKVNGEIVRVTNVGAGVKFIGLTKYQEEMIDQLVERMDT